MNAAVEKASLSSAGVEVLMLLKTCSSAVILPVVKSGESNPFSVRNAQTRSALVKMNAKSGRKTLG